MSEVGELKAVLASERIEREREFRDLSDEIARLRSRNHPWCSDIERDTAIRAAEDAAASERPPLPDHRELPERVARLESVVFGVTESRSADARTEETSQSGLRTERVTLEMKVLTECPPLTEWPWDKLPLNYSLRLLPGESVRVVPQSEADAEVLRQALAKSEVERLRQDVGVAEEDAALIRRDNLRLTKERDAALARVAELEKRSSFLSQHKEAWAYETMLDGWEISSREWAESEPELHWIKLTAPEENGNANGSEGDRAGTGCVRCGGAGEGGVLAGDAGRWVEVKQQDDAERNGSAVARETEPEANRQAALDRSADAEPVAWLHEGLGTSFMHPNDKLKANCVPLYRAPPPPRGWLSADEKTAIEESVAVFKSQSGGFAYDDDNAAVEKDLAALRSVLSRNSPPMVRMPKEPLPHHYRADAIASRDTQWLAALAAAGVEVEV